MTSVPLNRQGITLTYQLIRPHVRRTPTIEVDGADFGLPGTSLAFKAEMLQHSGSFKVRGAFANLLTREVPAAGVVAASGGNHGAAVALAASRLNQRATIFVPTISSPAKTARIRACGAELVVTGNEYADALVASQEFAAKTGALAIHAYDQLETMLGQGTAALELEEQCPNLDTALIAVGGGGLLGGMAAWYAGRLKLVAVEPEKAPTLKRALEAGKPIDIEAGGIAADSLGARRVGELTFPLAQKYVTEVLLVPDSDIQAAQQALWDVLRLVVEPGGAAAFAAVLAGKYRSRSGEKIGIVLSGGNTTAVNFDAAVKTAAS
ncbi:MAG TPA: threonine/serine dehydratase [Alphaproteobacteria bacterium]|nr:threonine/serine dehydratase [Alphaproteobacteria bacterium]